MTAAGGQDPGGPGCGRGRGVGEQMGVGLKSCARAEGGAKTFLGELGGGAETLDDRAGGGARKFCLSLMWVHIVGSDFRG